MLRDIRLRLQDEVIERLRLAVRRRRRRPTSTPRSRRSSTGSSARNGFAVTRDERLRLIDELVGEIGGLGPLEPLLADETITEVMVNGPNHIYIERGGKIERVDSAFLNDEHVLRIIDRIITPIGRRIDQSSPRVDARLPDGSRVNAIIAPLSLVGPVITDPEVLRQAVHGGRPRSASGRRRPRCSTSCRACVEARLNVFVSGGTGSGKTTTLNVLSSFIPEDERIVTIEDAAELQLRQQHVVTLEARPPNLEGQGEITIRDLLRNALHMRPDRIIVGECRAGEALDMIQAMTMGQEGSLSTGHANSPPDMLRRLETMVLMAGVRAAAAVDPRADRLGRRPDRPHGPAQGRLPQDRQHHRGLRDRGRRDPHPGHLRLRADRRSSTGRSRGCSSRPGSGRRSWGSSRRSGIELPPGEFGIPPEDPAHPTRPRARGDGAPARRSPPPDAARPPVGHRPGGRRPGAWSTSRRSGRSIPRPARSSAARSRSRRASACTNLKAKLEAEGSSLEKVVWANWSLRDPAEFDTFNEEWVRWFPGDAPIGQGTLMPPLQRRAGFRISIGVIAEA